MGEHAACQTAAASGPHTASRQGIGGPLGHIHQTQLRISDLPPLTMSMETCLGSTARDAVVRSSDHAFVALADLIGGISSLAVTFHKIGRTVTTNGTFPNCLHGT
jgi:hypothetical protein